MGVTRRRSLFETEQIELDPWEGAASATRELQEERGDENQRQEQEKVASRLRYEEWQRMVPEAHGPIDLARFPFQAEPFYSEAAIHDHEQVQAKATQVGASSGQIRVALFHTDVLQHSVLYTFPTDKELVPFGRSRFGPIIRGSERLTSRMDSASVNNATQKQIGLNGWLYLRGTMRPIESLPIDMLIADELDYCFAAGTMVLTRRGHVPIEEVEVGDEVLTHRGRWRRVSRVGSRHAEQTAIVTAHGVPNVHTTPEHPFYVRRSLGKQRVDDGARRMVSRGQRDAPCEVAGCDGRIQARGLCGAHYQRLKNTGNVRADVPIEMRHARYGGPTPHRRGFTEPDWHRVNTLRRGDMLAQVLSPEEPDDRSVEYWWFIGRYLADGCRDKSSVHIDCADNEADELQARLDGLFPNVKRKPYANARAVRFSISSRALCAELEPYGRLAHGKRLTGHALSLDRERSCALLEGYVGGDGTYNAVQGQYTATTVSRALAVGVAMLVHRAYGIVAGCFVCTPPESILVPQGTRCVPRTPYRVAFSLANRSVLMEGAIAWKPVRSVKAAGPQTVWNLTVDEDNSFTADGAVVHNSDQDNLSDSLYRVTGPNSAGLVRYLGVPTIPGYGIDKHYEASDQRVWMVKCTRCSKQNPIAGFDAFEQNVDQDSATLVCRKCRKPINVLKGQWVATYQDRDVKGYRIPKLVMSNRRILRGVLLNSKKTRPTELAAFFNRDLGEAWAPAEGRLSLDQVQACVRPELRPVDPRAPHATHALRFMGIDMASKRALNVTIEEKIGDDQTRDEGKKLWVGTIDDDPARGTAFNQVCELIDRFNIHMTCVDNSPDGRFGDALAARYPGRVYNCSFTDVAAGRRPPQVMKVDDLDHSVSIWRTAAYDATLDRFRRQQVLLPPLDLLPEDYAKQLGNVYRQEIEVEHKAAGKKAGNESTGVVRIRYVKTGPEDYAQAEAYCLTAIEMFWRNTGLGLVADPTPTPLAQIDPYARVEDDDDDGPPGLRGEPGYRSPF